MIWQIVQLIFPLLTVAVTWLLYRNNRRMLAQTCCMVLGYNNGFKFLVQILMVTSLVFHFVYSCAYKDFGIMISTILVVSLYRKRWSYMLLHWLHKHPKIFFFTAFGTVALAIVPNMYTLAVTIDYVLLAAICCPPSDSLSIWENIKRLSYKPKR